MFDCPCCAEIIQTVTNIADAVDGTVVGQLTVERYEISGDYHIHLYYWNNSDWTIILDTSSLYQSADPAGFYDYQFNKFSNNWQYSLDQGQTWTDTEDYIFPEPVESITIWFKNLDNGCVYANLPIIPFTYCGTNYGIFADIGSAPSGFSTEDVAMVSYLDSGVTDWEYRQLYQWDGGTWVMMVETITIPPQSGSSPNPAVIYIDPAWLISYDSGASWGIDSFPNTPAETSVTIWYKNTNGCIYQNNPST